MKVLDMLLQVQAKVIFFDAQSIQVVLRLAVRFTVYRPTVIVATSG
ncbi:hypothetical protein DSUL_30115 [Desulfovibrionales bacterium]